MAARMIKDQQQNSTSTFSGFMQRLARQGGTWVFLSIMVYTILFSSSWIILKSILSWYSSTTNSSPVMISGWWPSALYELVALGVVLRLQTMAVAVAVFLPETVVVGFIMFLLLTLCGKSERKLMAEVRRVAMKILIKGMLSPLFVPFWVILLLLGGAEKMLGLLRLVLKSF